MLKSIVFKFLVTGQCTTNVIHLLFVGIEKQSSPTHNLSKSTGSEEV